MTPVQFRRLVWAQYKKEGRHALPWRKTRDVYHILVSEVMLQQTQVDRVIPFYTKFLTQFPTARKLAAAPLSHVLKAWQGLGYNRRAKMLRAASSILAREKARTVTDLEALPGVGPYTAKAVAAFAWNQDGVVIETNIRTAVIHHFFKTIEPVTDSEIAQVLEKTLPKGKAREWYSALMDYGASLKRSGISYNARGVRYVKQSKFTGSAREARGAILRTLSTGPASSARLYTLLGPSRRSQMRAALTALCIEQLVTKEKRLYRLGD
jgi:A/G-specific adenine glycosylase